MLVKSLLFRPVSNSSLAVFRIVFGVMIFAEIRWEWAARVGLVEARPIRFPFMGVEWLPLLPTGWGEAFLGFVLLTCAGIAAGLWFRAAAILFTVSYTWMFLLDRAYFNNHNYLICMLGGWLAVSDAHRRWSLDSVLWPSIKTTTVPAWQVNGIIGQISVAYFFGGVAKINPDWLRGEPMAYFLNQLHGMPVLSVFSGRPWLAVAFAWGGMLFDLLIAPALLWRRTRLPAIAAMSFFHYLNANMFSIGIFPWLSMGAIAIFLPPDFFERLERGFWSRHDRHPAGIPDAIRSPAWQRWITIAFIAWFTVQALVPLRRFLLPGNVGWTREGFYFAWTMKLDHKSRFLALHACDPISGECTPIDYRSDLNRREANWLPGEPRAIAEYARFLAARLTAETGRPPVIVCDSVAALNGRPYQYMIDPRVDVSEAPLPRWRHAEWIVPLNHAAPVGNYVDFLTKQRLVMDLVHEVRVIQQVLPPGLVKR
jgi:vitamin K-dependent gamma-carboxylase